MASDPLSNWRSLSLEETGGFAGLRRGVTITPDALDATQRASVDLLLQRLKPHDAETPRRGGPAMPDQQTLTLRAELPSGAAWEISYDTADLPHSLAALVKALPPLKPLPY